jgi:hypothetical protein
MNVEILSCVKGSLLSRVQEVLRSNSSITLYTSDMKEGRMHDFVIGTLGDDWTQSTIPPARRIVLCELSEASDVPKGCVSISKETLLENAAGFRPLSSFFIAMG